MDYKDKYKKVLAKAREAKKETESAVTIGILEDIFPELRESKDEQHRKWILEYLYDGLRKSDEQFKDQFRCAIAWLEKQGESKNIDSDDLATLEIWEDAIKENKEKWQLSDWFVEATSLLIQKVKRIENNENINIKGSRVMLNACINALRTVGHSHLSDWLEKQGEQTPFYYENMNFQQKDFSPKPQRIISSEAKEAVYNKPAEWKQENVGELSDFENAMMHTGRSFFGENAGLDPNDTDTIKEQAELLLELAPKIEWSEEDEKMFKYALDMIEWYSGKNENKSRVVSNWLKSIKDRVQPQTTWKPSKEQLYVLHWLATNVLGDGIVDEKASEILYRLYDDLKRL